MEPGEYERMPQPEEPERQVEMTVQAKTEESRAIQMIQAKIITAKKFPRDIVRAKARILEECKSMALAEKAQYKFPKGDGKMVTGATIRLTEVVARNYGNLDFGVRELERRPGSSVAQAYCWDLENNVTSDKVFEVPHSMKAKGRIKTLTDPRDIYELVANNGARRLRACIIAVVPNTIMEDAEAACRQTLVRGGGEPIEKRLASMVLAFKALGVSAEMIEERMGHKLEQTTAEEIVDLIAIHNSIRDKLAKRGDFFNFPEDVLDEEAASIAEKIANM